ncbi:MAG: SWIM zinc finger family protein [Faecalicoccus sp.]|nr:SWIM zinc finger family protein [Faecalicoccus sp.]
MGFIDVASGKSIWRGLDYYENKKVISWHKTGDYTYEGQVEGNSHKQYSVMIDIDHPKRSTCTCPFADGRRVVCKHMIALYFTAIPQAAEDFMKEVEEYERQEELERQAHLESIRKYVNSLSKKELQERLYNALVELEEKNRYW